MIINLHTLTRLFSLLLENGDYCRGLYVSGLLRSACSLVGSEVLSEPRISGFFSSHPCSLALVWARTLRMSYCCRRWHSFFSLGKRHGSIWASSFSFSFLGSSVYLVFTFSISTTPQSGSLILGIMTCGKHHKCRWYPEPHPRKGCQWQHVEEDVIKVFVDTRNNVAPSVVFRQNNYLGNLHYGCRSWAVRGCSLACEKSFY